MFERKKEGVKRQKGRERGKDVSEEQRCSETVSCVSADWKGRGYSTPEKGTTLFFLFLSFLLFTRIPIVTPYTYAHTTYEAMLGTYGWIFLTGVIVFFLVIVLLLCFTRSPIALSENVGNADFDEWLIEPEDEVATLPEDARLSYERAKGKSYEEGMHILDTYMRPV